MKIPKPNFHLPQSLLLVIAICLSGLGALDAKQIELLTPEAISLNKNWVLEKGILTPSETPGGIIWSKDSFGDFEISLQYKTSKKANSGLFFRTDPKNAVQGGFEIQIASPGIYSGKHIVGSLYDAKEPVVAAGKPDGEWNTMEVTCKGPLIKVVLNGKPVIDLNRRLERTSQKPGWFEKQVQDRTERTSQERSFWTQYHGQPVWFRKVRINTQ